MSQGTISLNVFDRLALAFGRAYKAAPPTPGALYAGRGYQSAAGPISFPGWEGSEGWYQQWGRQGRGEGREGWYQQGGQQGQRDEATAKVAITSPWVFSAINANANEVSTSTVVVKRRVDGGDEDVENHPFEQLWEKPNPFMGRGHLMQ